MKNRNIIRIMKKATLISLPFIFMLLSVNVNAQEEINKEVRVVKAYSPTISDAFKARFLPVIDDTLKVETNFKYYIEPVISPIRFRLEPLEFYKLQSEPSPQLKNTYVKAGFGNFWTPYAEMDINTTRNSNTSLGFHAGHLSSQGRIKMADDRKVYSGYADNQVKLYGSRIGRGSTFSADAHFMEDHHYLYGYSTDTLSDNSLVTPEAIRFVSKDSVPYQQFLVVGSDIRLKSNERTRGGFEYQLDLGYDYLNKAYRDLDDKNNEMEHGGRLGFDFSHELRKFTYGAELGGDYFYRIRSTDSVGNLIIKVDPWIGFKWEIVSLMAGPRIAFNRFDDRPWVFPRLKMEVNITNTVVPYIGLDGYFENNNLLKIKGENPFIVDDLVVEPTIHRFIAFGGLRGRFLPRAAFNLYIKWEDVEDWHFYLADRDKPARNRFDVVYDDGSLLSMGGEIGIHPSTRLGFILKGNYYRFNLDSLDQPWHRPEWDISLTTRYSFLERISLQADVYLIGPQFAPSEDIDKYGPYNELDGLIDINLSGEYEINKSLSAFLRLNNIISDSYYVWQNYPVQGFNFLVGASLSF
jgi:hypothetical protein